MAEEVGVGKSADIIAEGVAIATSAARLTVKNHILVGTIAQGGSFDVSKYVNDAREALLALAAAILGRGGSAASTARAECAVCAGDRAAGDMQTSLPLCCFYVSRV